MDSLPKGLIANGSCRSYIRIPMNMKEYEIVRYKSIDFSPETVLCRRERIAGISSPVLLFILGYGIRNRLICTKQGVLSAADCVLKFAAAPYFGPPIERKVPGKQG